MPLPGYKVIPDGWAEYHRPAAASLMTSECTVTRATDGPAPFPLPPGWTGTQTLWTGNCRLQQHNRESAVDAAGQSAELRRHLIGFPYDTTNPLPALRVGDTGDLVNINGRTYILRQRLDASEEFQHDFIAEENQTQNNP